jgi:uncharacterized protein
MLVVVLDTNVLVSSLLNPIGSPGKILDLIIGNHIQAAFDDRILEEYEDVLSRPELHIPRFQILATIDHLELSGTYVESEPLPSDVYPDPDDIIFAEVFMSSNATVLVTGNLRHCQTLIQHGRLVLSPAKFLEKYFPA